MAQTQKTVVVLISHACILSRTTPPSPLVIRLRRLVMLPQASPDLTNVRTPKSSTRAARAACNGV